MSYNNAYSPAAVLKSCLECAQAHFLTEAIAAVYGFEFK